MPFRNTSVMGGSQGWQYDDQEKAAIDAKNRYGDQAARMYLAQMQSNDNRYNTDAQVGAGRYAADAQLASTGKYSDRADTELKRFGTFDDNAQHDYAMGSMKSKENLAAATLQYGAGNKREDREDRQYNDTRVSTVAKANAEAEKIQLRNALIKDFYEKAKGSGQAGAVPGAAPGAAPRGGVSDEEMFFLMNDGNPADLMKSRSEDKRYERELSAQAEQNRMGLGKSLADAGNVKGAVSMYRGANGFKDMTDEELSSIIQKPIDPIGIEKILQTQLPDFINRDTQSAWSRGLKGGTAGAAAGALTLGGAGALFGGVPAIPGAIGGGIGGFVLGGIGGAMSNKGDPEDSEGADIQALFSQLVEGYTAQNGGRRDLAVQQAKAKMVEYAKTSVQGDDFLTDWDGDKTKLLFQGLK